MCKKKKSCKRWRSFLAILDFFCGEKWRWGVLVLYKIPFLVAFRENWNKPVCKLMTCCWKRALLDWSKREATRRPRITLRFTPPVLNVDVSVFCLFSWHIDGCTGWQTLGLPLSEDCELVQTWFSNRTKIHFESVGRVLNLCCKYVCFFRLF